MDFDLDFVEKYMETDNGQAHYLHHAGHDESIIFVHGFGANARTWKRLAGIKDAKRLGLKMDYTDFHPALR